jgi:hypothetical protein
MHARTSVGVVALAILVFAFVLLVAGDFPIRPLAARRGQSHPQQEEDVKAWRTKSRTCMEVR